ncbi:MAG: hypothetical protein K6G55_04635 [Selenomonadaceae bacterium]|nr:hypothetical protein [Selenomonadaceae bacterium]
MILAFCRLPQGVDNLFLSGMAVNLNPISLAISDTTGFDLNGKGGISIQVVYVNEFACENMPLGAIFPPSIYLLDFPVYQSLERF